MLEIADFTICFEMLYPASRKNVNYIDEKTIQYTSKSGNRAYQVEYCEEFARQFTARFQQPCHILRGLCDDGDLFFDVATRVDDLKELLLCFHFDKDEMLFNISILNGLDDHLSYFNLQHHAECEPLIEEMKQFVMDEFVGSDPKCRLYFLTQSIPISLHNWHTG